MGIMKARKKEVHPNMRLITVIDRALPSGSRHNKQTVPKTDAHFPLIGSKRDYLRISGSALLQIILSTS